MKPICFIAAREDSRGVPNKNIKMIDRKGVIYRGRDNLNQWKSAHAIETKDRTLEQAIKGADVFLGLSTKGVLTKKMVKSMSKNPIIFACANPDPEITPEEVSEVRNDAIVATGRSDYPNQVNNIIGFPYIFRGALDVRSKTINEDMKVAASQAIAKLAREDVPDEVVAAMGGERPKYGKEYIIPSTFDPRLISVIPVAVAKAAIKSGVARKEIKDFEVYKDQLKQRLDPSVTIMQGINSQIKKTQNTIEFLRQTWLFGESISTPVQSQIAQKMKLRKYEKGASINCEGLMLVKEGKEELLDSGTEMKNSLNEVVEKGGFWGCEQMILNKALNSKAIALASSFIYSIAETEILEQIPIVRWKLLEQAQKRA